jgi:peptidoglycan/xylan/chitin deacetylase (PgdA/CDA1 family)
MRDSPGHQKPRPIITTSWDDGHPLDLKVAELLAKYGLRGTFYVPARYEDQPVLGPVEIRELVQLGMEIGSHTMSHRVLTQLALETIEKELTDSRRYLEDILGKDVFSFCYPKGKFSRLVRSKVAAAGYRLARTTVSFRTGRTFDPLCMPVSFQFYCHKKITPLKHAMKEGNWIGLLTYAFRYRFATDPMLLSLSMLKAIAGVGGVLHLWGHSWELDEAGLWPQFEDVLRILSGQDRVTYLTNIQVLKG